MLVPAVARPVRGIPPALVPALCLAAALALVPAALVASPARAAGGLELTTPFPSVAVQPGSSTKFTLSLSAASAMTVAVSVSGAPEGWTAALHGGGMDVRSVYVAGGSTATLDLDVSVPNEAAEGSTTLTVSATGPGGASATLPVGVEVAQAAGGSVELTTDVPTLQGNSDGTFSFAVQLRNATPQQLTFSLQAVGPDGWTVSAQPSGQEQAASFTVDAGATKTLDVKADPPDDVAAGEYPIGVQAVGSGGRTAEQRLTVKINGRVDMALTTQDGRLNADATAGSSSDLSVVVENNGTAPLAGVQLTATAPSGWEVTFEPATLDAIDAQGTGQAVAHIKPSGDAIAGDYVVTIHGKNDQADQSMDVRVTVETSPIWGALGIILILAAVGGLFYVFQRYGRR